MKHESRGLTHMHAFTRKRTYLVAFDNVHNFASDLVPEENLTPIRPRHDELAVGAKKVGFLYLICEFVFSSTTKDVSVQAYMTESISHTQHKSNTIVRAFL